MPSLPEPTGGVQGGCFDTVCNFLSERGAEGAEEEEEAVCQARGALQRRVLVLFVTCGRLFLHSAQGTKRFAARALT